MKVGAAKDIPPVFVCQAGKNDNMERYERSNTYGSTEDLLEIRYTRFEIRGKRFEIQILN